MLGRLLPRHLEIIYLINYNHMEVIVKKVLKKQYSDGIGHSKLHGQGNNVIPNVI